MDITIKNLSTQASICRRRAGVTNHAAARAVSVLSQDRRDRHAVVADLRIARQLRADVLNVESWERLLRRADPSKSRRSRVTAA
jgi:hypothetical protein